MYPILTLKSGKEANVAFRHPWIFSGAFEDIPNSIPHGSIVQVADKHHKILATGTFSSKSSIAVRCFAFGEAVLDRAWLKKGIAEADARRHLMGYGPDTDTTGYRVVFGEADNLPGLVVDRFGDVVVFQISTAGLDSLREDIVAAITETLHPICLIERSDMPVRAEEGLKDVTKIHAGAADDLVPFVERGIQFLADPVKGQKTGFFLDQKDSRTALGRLAKGRVVLNLFSYSGAAGINMVLGGAKSVHNVDASADALELCRKHAELHEIPDKLFTTEESDIFQWLGAGQEQSFGMVVLDPPALLKSMKDAEEGRKAYHFLNRAAMRLVEDGGIFATSSCSHFLSEDDLAFTLRRASVQAGLKLDMLAVVRQSPDHPLSIYFPESAYLKTFIFRVSR
jgi:23S rRNA (cytosine1962-C5)-methyltransferase